MRFGFHISITGGLSRVVPRASKLGCETIQFFSRNPRAWKNSLINQEEIQKFQEALIPKSITPIFIHAPYLLNLASPDKSLHTRSLHFLCEELKQAGQIGAQFVIVHFGNKMKTGDKEAIKRVANAINATFERVSNSVQLLLENTAGQGTEIGYKIYHFREALNRIEDQDRIGICLDTAHAFAAGYDLSASQGLDRMLEEFEALIGLNKLKLLHLNDCRVTLGSKKDRHWHIGKGEIGRSGFSHIVNHPKLAHLPGIMETPRRTDADDRRNMKVMRSLIY